jgi:hypothetical protein
MVEPEKSEGADPHARKSAEYVGWLVRLDIIDSRARGEDQSSEVDNAVDLRGLGDVLRLIEAEFLQLTVPLLGKSERVLPSRAFIRLGKICRRWERLLCEKTGDNSLFRVRVRLEPAASDVDTRPDLTSDHKVEELMRRLQVEVQIQNVGDEPLSSRDLLGRFHPDHREPNICDAIEETRRQFEERQRKKTEGG